MSGPAISVIVRYSLAMSARLQFLEVLVHHREGLVELRIELLLVLDPGQELPRLDRGDVLDGYVEGDGLAAQVRELLDRGDELELPLGRAERVDGMVRVLLQEDLADHP